MSSRALACALVKLGLPPELAFAVGTFSKVLFTEDGISEVVHGTLRMMPAAGGNADSGSWERYLNLSSDSEGQGQEHGEAQPSSSSPASPSPSWFEEAEDYYRTFQEPGEGSSAAPNPELEARPTWVLDEINARLKLVAPKKGNWQVPIDKISTLIALKERAIHRMVELEPDFAAFWRENKNQIVAHSILTSKSCEFSVSSLQKRVDQLDRDGVNSAFFKELKKLHPDNELN